ncbi:MAG: hypothetical protein V3U97_02700 [bacterium]
MKTWSLKQFKEEKGMKEAMRVMGFTNYRSLYPAIDRDITIRLDDGVYESREDQLIKRVPEVG